MNIEMLQVKLHRATITDANLNYQGSITIDKAILKQANLLVGQKVEIANINNGERFSTYIIEGEANSGTICLNGAAARKAQIGDKVIIMAYAMYNKSELESYFPSVLLLDNNNKVISHKKEL
ncbi:aspartate 1-decarboxylase [Helicobacter sp. MIT 14-3879]|uniref:aspartate 1-decarboxylase n=1 Tax=Helicobacter sp. MIT 14-3879 TaxID=2040649 RepID=UPI000E1F9A34|nr:aspartate 1-decarboxylase [Helicobacter sp. MIT 14-3879]RDU64796.1 aspartate 1-decarboxylase [Helicobacter sp. MIT 14-3879]